MWHRAERQSQIVRPQNDCEDTLPEREVQKPDREEPCCDPEGSRETVLLDLDLLHGYQTPVHAAVAPRGSTVKTQIMSNRAHSPAPRRSARPGAAVCCNRFTIRSDRANSL